MPINPKEKIYTFGFTLIELLVVIAIIGILSTLAVVALSNARSKARDSKRVADIQQISKALELYYQDNSSYPTLITPGNSLVSPDGLTTYMAKIPANPSPKNDNGCGNNDYTYSSTPDNTNYSLNFCLGNPVASTPAGINSASNAGVGTAPGLVGWWKFDEGSGTTAIDSSGNNNHGTWYGAGATHYALGVVGPSAAQFDGLSDYINVGTPSILDFSTNDLTISTWAKAVGGITGRGIINKGGWGSNGYSIQEAYSPANIYFFVIKYGSSRTEVNTSLGETWDWKHITAVKNGGILLVYINGVLASSSVGSFSSISNPSKNFEIGRSFEPYYFNGLIDDLRVYNRALSTAEITALYNATKP